MTETRTHTQYPSEIFTISHLSSALIVNYFLCKSILYSKISYSGAGLDNRRFDSQQGVSICLFTTVSRPALVPTQPPKQWVPGALWD